MDTALFTYLNMLPSHVPALARAAVPAAKDGIFLYAALLLWLWFRSPRTAADGRRTLLLAVAGAALSLAVNAGLNAAFPRPRPFVVLPAHVLVPRPHDASFPSDHAAVAAAVAAVLLLGGQSGWGLIAAAGALLIGAARVMVGVHYPSDILGGFLVGVGAAAAVIRAKRLLQPVLDRAIGVARQLRLG